MAANPSGVWRVLSQAGLLSGWTGRPSRKGTGLVDHCTNVRLNSATCYLTPKDMVAGRQQKSMLNATESWR